MGISEKDLLYIMGKLQDIDYWGESWDKNKSKEIKNATKDIWACLEKYEIKEDKYKLQETTLKESEKGCECHEGSKSFIGDTQIFTCYDCGGQFIVN